MEYGATFPSTEGIDGSFVAAMFQRRREWIEQAVAIANRWHGPLTAIRVIHEYVVGFNWPVVLNGFNER